MTAPPECLGCLHSKVIETNTATSVVCWHPKGTRLVMATFRRGVVLRHQVVVPRVCPKNGGGVEKGLAS
jgi:hypothetical protein